MGFFVNNESHDYFSFNTDWTEKEVEFLYSCSEDTSASKLNTWSVKLKSSSGFKRLCPPVVNCASPVDYAASGYVWTVSVAVTHSWGEIQLPTFSTSRGPCPAKLRYDWYPWKKMGWGVCVCENTQNTVKYIPVKTSSRFQKFVLDGGLNVSVTYKLLDLHVLFRAESCCDTFISDCLIINVRLCFTLVLLKLQGQKDQTIQVRDRLTKQNRKRSNHKALEEFLY